MCAPRQADKEIGRKDGRLFDGAHERGEMFEENSGGVVDPAAMKRRRKMGSVYASTKRAGACVAAQARRMDASRFGEPRRSYGGR